MSGRNAKLLASYCWAMAQRDSAGRIIGGPKVRDLKRAWKTYSAKEKAAMRRALDNPD